MVTQGKLLKLHHFHPSRRRGSDGERFGDTKLARIGLSGGRRIRFDESFGSSVPVTKSWEQCTTTPYAKKN